MSGIVLPNLILATLTGLGLVLMLAALALRWTPSTQLAVFMGGTSLSLMTRLHVPISDVMNVRAGHLVVAGLWGLLLLRRGRVLVPAPIVTGAFLLLTVLMAVSTLLNFGYGTEARGFVKVSLLVVYVLGFAWLIVAVGRRRPLLEHAARWFWTGVVLYASLTLALMAFSYLRFGMDLGRWYIGIRGLQFWEFAPEEAFFLLYGPGEASLVAAGCVIGLALVFQGARRNNTWLGFAILVLFLAMLLSLSRAAWWGFLAGCTFLSAYCLRHRATFERVVIVGSVCLVLMGALILSSEAVVPRWGIFERFTQIADVSEGTGQARWAQYQRMLVASIQGPLWGHGAHSHLLITEGLTAENFFLEFFYAAGWGGLLSVTVGLFAIFRSGRRGLARRKTASDMRHDPWPLALAAGAVSLLGSGMLAAVVWLPQFWIALGLVVAAARATD